MSTRTIEIPDDLAEDLAGYWATVDWRGDRVALLHRLAWAVARGGAPTDNPDPRRDPATPYGVTYGNGETRIGTTGFVFPNMDCAREEAARVMESGWDAATVPTDLPDDLGFPIETPIFAADIETEDEHVGTLYPDGRWRVFTDAEALDRLNTLLSAPEWPGASGMEDVAEIVRATGRIEIADAPEWAAH